MNLRPVNPPLVHFSNSSSRVHRLWTSLSKNRTNFYGSVLASMALTQRLEFRQSQSLVMTPQLMQAIKLLQLSNLDLSAFVEEELERNPLLERASDGTEPPVAGEPAPERAEFSDSDDSGAPMATDRVGRAFRDGQRLRRRRLRAGPGRVDEPRPRQPRRDRADAGHRRSTTCFPRSRPKPPRATRRMRRRPPTPNGAAAPPTMRATISKPSSPPR